MLTVVLQLFPRKHWRQSCYRPLSDNSRCSARVAGPSCQRFWDSHRNTLGQSEGRCHFRLFHKVSLQVEDTESGMGCGGVVEICQITEFKMLPFFCRTQQRGKLCSGPGSTGCFMLMFKGQSTGCSLWHWHSGEGAACGKDGIQTGREALTIRPWLLSVLLSFPKR